MKLIKGERERCPLDALNTNALKECDEVWAAVAYVTDDDSLIRPCYKNGIPLKLWARYDYTVPVRIGILEWFIGKSPLAVCKLVQDIFHPKVIWWRPYGVYIGSANLTKAAWGGNFEAGVFLTEDEIDDQGMRADLEEFFEDIDEVATPITSELVKELKQLKDESFFRDQERFRREFEQKRQLPKLESLLKIRKRADAGQRRQTEFLREWNQTLGYIRDIATKLDQPENRPAWVNGNVPGGVHADQFLHAFYYQKVMESRKALHRQFHEQNRSRPDQALDKALSWWRNLPEAPSSEAVMMHEHAPFIAGKLSRENIQNLTEDDLIAVFTKVHAFRNYADRTSYRTLNLREKLPQMTTEQRGVYLARRLYGEFNAKGQGILDLLEYLLYGGPQSGLPRRLYEVSFSRDHTIPFAGLSTFGEIVGWALPDSFPPRNGRTSKALYALGYDVKVHTE
jgi:hypothetical protein